MDDFPIGPPRRRALEDDTTCSLCGSDAGHAVIRGGEIGCGYESRHDTGRFVFVADPALGETIPMGGPVCDACIDGMVAAGTLFAYASDMAGPLPDLDVPALEAAFRLGVRQGSAFVEAARMREAGDEAGCRALLPWGLDREGGELPGAVDIAVLPLARIFEEEALPSRAEDPRRAGILFVLGHRAVLGRLPGSSETRARSLEWASDAIRRRAAMAELRAEIEKALGED